ncbi:MAG: class I SAM-dependent methyltransferase [Patescibacteria group bacterium]
MIKNFLTTKITRQELKKFIQKHSSDKLTLDLGCSNSPYSKYFLNRVGFDIQDGKGVDIIGDAHKLPFEDEKFDVILCTEVLEHLHSPHIAISEMKRVLKLNGKLILTTRFIFPIHDSPNDFYRYTKYGLKYLFKDWRIESIQEESNTVETLFILLQRIGYQTELRVNKITKLLLFIFVKFMPIFSFFVKKEYGDIQREKIEKNIMTSGYYLICQK